MKRIKKCEMSEELPELTIHQYEGLKRPVMLHHSAISSHLPLKIVTRQVISSARVAENPNTPEFAGYTTNIERNEGYSPKPKTKDVYLPLVDMPPAEPTIILTNAAGQYYTIVINDQQLYRVAVNITWVYNDLLVTLIPRLGRMHTLINIYFCFINSYIF